MTLPGFEAESFDEVAPEMAKERVKMFLDDLSGCCETGYEDGVGYFILGENSKVQYFLSMYYMFRNLANQLTIDDFTASSQKVKQICRVLDDDYSDAIVVNDTVFTLDNFLRDAEIGVKYYVGPNVIEMG